MQGMISQARGKQPAAAENSAEEAQAGAGEGREKEQGQKQGDGQKLYDVAAGQMLNFVYDDQGVQALTELMQAIPDDPQAAMAKLLGRLLTMTAQSAALAGKRVPPDVLFQAGIETVRAMSEVAQSKGLLDPKQEQAVTEGAFFDGVANFANEAKEEALTRQERQAYVQLLDQLEAMEKKARGGQPVTAQGQQPAQSAAQPSQPAGGNAA